MGPGDNRRPHQPASRRARPEGSWRHYCGRHHHRRPSSTKSEAKARDPEMHQTRKGQQWYFGMKLHIGVDSKTKLIHSLKATTANVHDAKVLGELLYGDETRVYGDQAYRGQTESKNRTKSGVRAKVEHPIGVIKRVFGYEITVRVLNLP
jgi:transposase, IS5 family